MSAPIRAVLALGFLAAGTPLRAQCPDGTPPPCAAAPRAVATFRVPAPDVRARRILVLPFRNVTRSPAHEWLTTGAPLMLSEALGQYRDLSIVAEERITAARRRLGFGAEGALDETQLRRLAQETDGWTAVTGNVMAMGPRLRITAQALDIPTARVLVRGEAEVDAEGDVRPAFNRLTVQLIEAAGVRGGATDVAALTTQSVDAYRAYVRGIQQWRASAYVDARRSFAEAVQLDSTFALAWARLANAWLSANLFDLVDPANPIGRAINNAAKHAGRLPPRQAQLVRSMQMFFNGRPAAARLLADSLVATDADDLDAREWAASVASMDPTIDVTAGPARFAASLNRPIAIAKEILERDPGRRHVHSIPVMLYALAAGQWGGMRAGITGEFPSIGAMLMQATVRNEGAFVIVMRDTLLALPLADFRRLSAGEQRMLRARGAQAASEWVERWLAAGPDDADAHLWASRIADLQGDIPRALREAVVAESLGVQSGWENMRSRRLRLLILNGNRAAAAALADSMLGSRDLVVRTPVSLDQGRAHAASIFIITKQWSKLERLITASAANPFGGQAGCINIVSDFGGGMSSFSPALAREVMDTAAAHFGALAASPVLQGCAGNFVGTLLVDSTTVRRGFAAARLVEKADSLFAAGNEPLAFRAMRSAWAADTSAAARGAMQTRGWFMKRARVMAFPSTFVPEAAFVDRDSAVFSYRATEQGPWILAAPRLPSHWLFSIEIVTDSAAFTIIAQHNYRVIEAEQTGGLREMLAALTTLRVTAAPQNFAAASSRVSAVPTPSGFQLVVRGPVVAELRRARARSARFAAEPCVAVLSGLCAGPSIAITHAP